MKRQTASNERGFSLVELLVAMVVTVIVGGAVVGLLSSGQSAFRREPEVSDRQQNIRVAQDLIMRDLGMGGTEMGAWFQSFTRGLNGDGPQGPTGANSDFLEVFGKMGTCSDVVIDRNGSNFKSANIEVSVDFPDCYSDPAMILLLYPGRGAKWGWGHNIHSGRDKLNFPPGQQPPRSQVQHKDYEFCSAERMAIPIEDGGCGALDGELPTKFGLLEFVRYEIALVSGVPNLYRTARGGVDADGIYVAAPDADGGWQLVARGIEDLQVEYRNGTNRNGTGWDADPGAVTCVPNCNTPGATEYNTIVREVRVTLSARSLAPRLAGQTSSSVGNALRGQLTSTATPRSALMYLSTPPDPKPAGWVAQWR